MNKRLPLVLTTFAVLSLRAHAETYAVTRLDDPLPDTCQPGDCSLREAAMAATLNDEFGPPDRIELAAGAYTLIRGELPVARQGIEVVGAGSAQTEVATDVALFQSYSQPHPLTVRGMTLHSSGGSVLSSQHMVLHDILVPAGGGTVGGSGDDVDVEVHDSEFRDTFRCDGLAGRCTFQDSTLFNLYVIPQEGSTLTLLIRRCTIDGSLDPDHAPASAVALHRGASIDIEDTTITHSAVRILTEGPPTNFRRVRYIDNLGPITTEVPAEVLVEDSEFRDNHTRAIYAANGAAWTVRGSSFVDNRVDGNAGGAVLVEDDTDIRISNSTFSGNTFTAAAAQDGARGAAIGFRNASAGAHLILRHVTIAAPSTLPAGVQGSALGGLDAGIAIDVSNSILKGSCALASGIVQNNSGNIESPGHGCRLDAGMNQVDVTSAALGLGALGDYGGPTPTYQPADDSVAVDHGSSPQCLDIDQRGYPRPFGDGCEVGAVEVGAGDALFADGFD